MALKESGVNVTRLEITQKCTATASASYDTKASQAHELYQAAYAKGQGVVDHASNHGREFYPKLADYVKVAGDHFIDDILKDGTWSAVFDVFDDKINTEASKLERAISTLSKRAHKRKRGTKTC